VHVSGIARTVRSKVISAITSRQFASSHWQIHLQLQVVSLKPHWQKHWQRKRKPLQTLG
jgi:hypothetical protein